VKDLFVPKVSGRQDRSETPATMLPSLELGLLGKMEDWIAVSKCRRLRDSVVSVRHRLCWHIACRKPVRSGTISVPRPDVILLQAVAYELYFDGAPSAIGIRLGIIAERVKMR